MTTELLYREDAYRRVAEARVLTAAAEGILLDRTPFYAQAGGQPGDAGLLRWPGGETPIVKAIKGEADGVLHVPAEGAALPAPGTVVEAVLDWGPRHRQRGSQDPWWQRRCPSSTCQGGLGMWAC